MPSQVTTGSCYSRPLWINTQNVSTNLPKMKKSFELVHKLTFLNTVKICSYSSKKKSESLNQSTVDLGSLIGNTQCGFLCHPDFTQNQFW